MALMNMLRDLLMSPDPVGLLRSMDAAGTLGAVDPALPALRMPQPAGVRHKDNLVHSLQVLENAMGFEREGADLILRTAALLHDIGKPATRKFEGKKTVTFEGHEHVGARMLPKLLKRHGYSKSEIEQVSVLVALHMRSHGFDKAGWTDSAVRRLMTDVGSEEQLERLIAIFYSDVTSKHAHKRAAVHASVTKLQEALKVVAAKDARAALRPALDGHQVMELFGLKPGPELGRVMKFLNSDEGIALPREVAVARVRELLS